MHPPRGDLVCDANPPSLWVGLGCRWLVLHCMGTVTVPKLVRSCCKVDYICTGFLERRGSQWQVHEAMDWAQRCVEKVYFPACCG